MRKVVALIAAICICLIVSGCKPSGGHGTSSVSSGRGDKPVSSGQSGADNTSSGEQAPGGAVNADSVFKTARNAKTVYIVDISNENADTVVFLRMLQGLAAKKEGASIYLSEDEADIFWSDHMHNELSTYFVSATAQDVVDQYISGADGLIIYQPGTFEYDIAWDLSVLSGSIAATADVAEKFGLGAKLQTTDIRGAYGTKCAAYDDIFVKWETICKDKQLSNLSLCGENSRFADYAYFSDAVRLGLSLDDQQEHSRFERAMQLISHDTISVAFTDGRPDEALRSVLSTYGYGAVAVGDFSNATLFSSVETNYDAQSLRKSYVKEQPSDINMALCISSPNLGTTVRNDYLVSLAKKENYVVTVQISPVMCKLAPSVLLWYSTHGRSSGDSIAPSGGWSDIDQSVISRELYEQWHAVNNDMTERCGFNTAVSGRLRDDTDNTSKFGAFSNADTLLVCEYGWGDGAVWFSEKTPYILMSQTDTIEQFKEFFDNMVIDGTRTMYYAVSLPSDAFFAKVPIYDQSDPEGQPTGYCSVTEIIEVFLCDHDGVKMTDIGKLSVMLR